MIKINRQILFISFIVVMLLESIFSPTLYVIGYLTNSQVFFNFPKIPLLLLFFISLLYFIKYEYLMTKPSILFVFYFCFSFTYGYLTNGLSGDFLSHLYGTIMPVLAINFGICFYRYSTNETNEKIIKIFKKNYKYLVFFIFVYFFMYKSGILTYFGISTYMGYYVSLFSSQGNVLLAVFSLLLIVLTGKRAILISGMIVLIIYLFMDRERKNITIFLIKTMSTILIPISIYYLYQYGFLDRFYNTINVDITSEHSLYLATGGRSEEILSLINHVIKEKTWLIGGGFGESFYINTSLTDDTLRSIHYSHMSPLYFVLIYGVPFSIIMYMMFIYYIFKSLMIKIRTFYFYMYIMLFITTFFGAVVFIDPKFWFSLGVVIGTIKYKSIKDVN